jgi:DNA helicase-2/ATP-dependent DNA helicase PcrA
MATLVTQTLQARKRLLATGRKGWSIAVLVPTKRMTRFVSDTFREPNLNIPPINHTASVDMEAAILGAEVIAFLLQPASQPQAERGVVGLVAAYYRGKGGDAVSQSSLKSADAIRKAHEKCTTAEASGKAPPAGSIFLNMRSAINAARGVVLTGDPDTDWRAVRAALAASACPRLREIANEVRNIRLLERGTQLRQLLAADWRDEGSYPNALQITRLAFVQEHFATSQKPESGIVVMNMHKAKGKQFDEVIIFEGWPVVVRGKVVANADRIVRSNTRTEDMGQARQNLRVSVTRARMRTTILTPRTDPCVLLVSQE